MHIEIVLLLLWFAAKKTLKEITFKLFIVNIWVTLLSRCLFSHALCFEAYYWLILLLFVPWKGSSANYTTTGP